MGFQQSTNYMHAWYCRVKPKTLRMFTCVTIQSHWIGISLPHTEYNIAHRIFENLLKYKAEA